MTWTYISQRVPLVAEVLPEQTEPPLACHLNRIVAVMLFSDEHGNEREVDMTWAMERRAQELEMTPEAYMAGLLGFAEKAVA